MTTATAPTTLAEQSADAHGRYTSTVQRAAKTGEHLEIGELNRLLSLVGKPLEEYHTDVHQVATRIGFHREIEEADKARAEWREIKGRRDVVAAKRNALAAAEQERYQAAMREIDAALEQFDASNPPPSLLAAETRERKAQRRLRETANPAIDVRINELSRELRNLENGEELNEVSAHQNNIRTEMRAMEESKLDPANGRPII